MSRYLLDTEIAIALLRGRNNRLVNHLAGIEKESVLISTVTVAELLFGALRSQNSAANIIITRQFCASFNLSELDLRSGWEGRIHPGRFGKAWWQNRRIRYSHCENRFGARLRSR